MRGKMKRIGGLYSSIYAFSNLQSAALRARKGKRHRPDVVAFHFDLETNLLRLRDELQGGLYTPGAYRTFRITDPKPRLISAAPYRDRVVHHALCNVIEPLFDRTFIYDSYANRTEKGTHRALDRCTEFARRYQFVLKCDITGYFPSVDHDLLKSCIAKTIKCPETLNLITVILDSSEPSDPNPRYFQGDNLFTPHERRSGIPIGNLTSQLFGNVYLNDFDHWMKEVIRAKGYLRFVDDFLIFSEDSRWLHDLLPRIQTYMASLRVRLHARKCQIVPVKCGVEFLGWQVFPDHRRLRRSTGVRFQRKLRALAEGYSIGEISHTEVEASVMSWLGHLKHGDTWGLRTSLLGQTSFIRKREQR